MSSRCPASSPLRPLLPGKPSKASSPLTSQLLILHMDKVLASDKGLQNAPSALVYFSVCCAAKCHAANIFRQNSDRVPNIDNFCIIFES